MGNDPLTDIGLLIVEYAGLPLERKKEFLQRHAELQSQGVIAWCLTAARLRSRMHDYEATARYAVVAFDISASMHALESAAEACELVIEAARSLGRAEDVQYWQKVASGVAVRLAGR